MAIETTDILRAHKKRVQARNRLKERVGLFILLSGYAMLAVDPETPSDWLLVRVTGGFMALLAGFGLAILPILTRMTGGDE